MSEIDNQFKQIAIDYGRGNFLDDNGKLYLVRCPSCERENYSMAVSSGSCCWCGWPRKIEGEYEK